MRLENDDFRRKKLRRESKSSNCVRRRYAFSQQPSLASATQQPINKYQPCSNCQRSQDQPRSESRPEVQPQTICKCQRDEERQAQRDQDQRLTGELGQIPEVVILKPCHQDGNDTHHGHCQQNCTKPRRPMGDFGHNADKRTSSNIESQTAASRPVSAFPQFSSRSTQFDGLYD